MIGYVKYFKTQIISGLQYKAAAFAGILTQVFWGFLNIMVFSVFYINSNESIGINLPQLISYVWLNQSFLALIYIRSKDNEIIDSIKKGTVAYELCRPYNLYSWWFIKIISKKISQIALRALPIIVLALLLPNPYKLQVPVSIIHFVLFVFSLMLGGLIIVSILMIIHSISFFTNQDKGISDIVFLIVDVLAGGVLPIPLLPKTIQVITEYLPFRLIGDLPFRIYSGNIGFNYIFKSIILQFIWLIILIIVGQLIMKKALKKVSIQGG